ncbi:copper amine oxidase domain-containing protein [Paenibacillus alvei TS-15]|uniref:Copper amine oxidase domain-containing protein n=1 Tax=Paenibacillus alvei TS-15 TaxID=1117108 RepID=S9TPL8_PAEAL|nr:stalk domain-containing protein [Paenibacillus alvei]EPY04266.1 copper amine oxidase domain-containing protein [Paenibacillus alvei TS-15]
MKKRIAVSLLIFVLSLALPEQASMEAFSQEPIIKDGNLEKAIRSWIVKKDDEPLTKADLESLTVVSFSGKGIKDLQGLEYAVNITDLDLDINEITDLTPLKRLSKIHTLSLKANKISSIDELSALKEMKYLDIKWNQISSLDVVKQLPRLVELSADHNQISNVQALSSAAELAYLKLDDNEIEDIAPLGSIKKLTYLNVSNNKIKDFSPLRKLSKSLTYLGIDGDQVTDLKMLEGFNNLEGLSANNNNIESLAPLAKLTKLSTLDLSSNKIKDLEPLNHLSELDTLYLDNNRVWNLEPLRNLKALRILNLNNNRVWDLEPIQNNSFDFHWDTGAERYGLQLNANYLDLSQGTPTYRIFKKLNADPYGVMSQRKTQRLIIGNKTAYLGDSIYNLTAAPFIQTGRTYVPIRFISEKLGANVNWNQNTKEVTIQKDGKTIRWVVGNKQVKINQQTVMSDAPLLLRNNTTFVPVRFVSEQLNTSVEYLGSKKMVIIFENKTK